MSRGRCGQIWLVVFKGVLLTKFDEEHWVVNNLSLLYAIYLNKAHDDAETRQSKRIKIQIEM